MSTHEATTASRGAGPNAAAPDGNAPENPEKFATPDGSPTSPLNSASYSLAAQDSQKRNNAATEKSPEDSARGSITASLPATASLGTDHDALKPISVPASDADFHSSASPAQSPRSEASKTISDAPAMGTQGKVVDECTSGVFQSAYSGSTVPTHRLEHGLEDVTVTSAGTFKPLGVCIRLPCLHASI